MLDFLMKTVVFSLILVRKKALKNGHWRLPERKVRLYWKARSAWLHENCAVMTSWMTLRKNETFLSTFKKTTTTNSIWKFPCWIHFFFACLEITCHAPFSVQYTSRLDSVLLPNNNYRLLRNSYIFVHAIKWSMFLLGGGLARINEGARKIRDNQREVIRNSTYNIRGYLFF